MLGLNFSAFGFDFLLFGPCIVPLPVFLCAAMLCGADKTKILAVAAVAADSNDLLRLCVLTSLQSKVVDESETWSKQAGR